MSRLPRFAVGTVQPDVDLRPASWSLLRLLKHMDYEVQSFLSRAYFPAHDGGHAATGQRTRHLDSWAMSRDVCGELTQHAFGHADIVVVEGEYDCARKQLDGGSLDKLCDWLDLPRIAVIDMHQLHTGCLPRLPQGIDGIFLDGVADRSELYRAKTNLEAIFNAPLIGSLPRVPGIRDAMRTLRDGMKPPKDLCDALARELSDNFWPEALLRLSDSTSDDLPHAGSFENFVDLTGRRVAVAYDDAFDCYFPDTLELLESRGATLVDFSPLSCESVPTDVDLVYFGCGPIEEHALALSNNCCLRQTLKQHVRQGGLVYAECAAIGYLCNEMHVDGETHRMVGILPATARRIASNTYMRPVRSTFNKDCWLGDQGDELRGYTADNWEITRHSQVDCCSTTEAGNECLLNYRSVIGSPMHIHFAAQPQRLHRFCRPIRSMLGAR